MKLDWSKLIPPKRQGQSPGKRGAIGSLSRRSAQRLVFGLANSPRPWAYMATLTFRERVMDGRKQLARFQRLIASTLGSGVHSAWVREYQGRGAVHFHYLWCKEALSRCGGVTLHNICAVKRGRSSARIVRGPLDDLIVEAWCDAVGDTSPEFINFQRGGIVQEWEGENGCARYFGSYLAKQEQKELPEDAEKSGRWWWICQEAKPVPIGNAYLTAYNRDVPLSVIFDKEPLMDHVISNPKATFIPEWWKPRDTRS